MEQLERKVTVIQPTIDLSVTSQKERKLKVCAYARVSTDLEEQKNSFDFQLKEYETQIKENPNWTFVKLYSDEGISGTSLKNREGFKQMIEDAKAGLFDLILTKSISRFARNVVDCIFYIRQLRDIGVDIYFEKENLHGLDEKCELVLNMFASIAQEESRSISENCKWGIHKRMQRNEYSSSIGNMLGLKKDELKKIVIDEETVGTVRQIYNLFLSGFTLREIANFLMDNNIKSPSGKDDWNISSIKSILTNEKYHGDIIYQKTYIKDYISHKAVKNNGELPKYYIENNHQAIVSKETFDKVQELLKLRASFSSSRKPRNIFFNLGECECCHRPLTMVTTHPNKDFSRVVLTCKTDSKHYCTSKPFDYSVCQGALNELIMKMVSLDNKNYIELIITDSLSDTAHIQESIDLIKKDNEVLQKKIDSLIESQIKTGSTSDLDFYEKTFTSIKNKIDSNNKEIQALENKKATTIHNECLVNKVKQYLVNAIAIDYDIVHYFISKVVFKKDMSLEITIKDKEIYKLFNVTKFTFANERGAINYTIKEESDVPASA